MAAKGKKNTLLTTIIDVITFLINAAYLIVKAIVELCLPSSYEPKKEIKGEVALVTGGGGGLGQLLALRLAKLGATVVVWDVNEEGIEATVNLVKGIGGKAYGYKCDLANNENVYKVAKKTQEEVGDVTILINNAGILSGDYLLDTPDSMIKKTFEVNILAHFWTVKAFLPKMIEKDHGHIVTIASMAGHVGVPKLVDYCSSKFAAIGFDEALKVELQSQHVKGVKTTVICPFFIAHTGMFQQVDTLVPTLKPNDVADRTILGLLREEHSVMIPRRFIPLMIMKSLVPFEVFSKFIRSLIPDAVPNHFSKPVVQVKKADNTSTKSNGSDISTSVSQLNQRRVVEGKNL